MTTDALRKSIEALFVPYPKGEHGPSDTDHYAMSYNAAIEDVLELITPPNTKDH